MNQEKSVFSDSYTQWLAEIKGRVSVARQRAALAVNLELVSLYWHIGREILQQQAKQGWGSKIIEWLGRDLREAFPEMKGFSRTKWKMQENRR